MASEAQNQKPASAIQSGRFILILVAAFAALGMIWPLATTRNLWSWNMHAAFLVVSGVAASSSALLRFRYRSAPAPSRFFLSHAFGMYLCASIVLFSVGFLGGGFVKSESAAIQTWSLFLPRFLLLAILILAALASYLDEEQGGAWKGTAGALWFWCALPVVVLAFFFFLFPLPRTFSSGVVGGAQELLTLLLALAGFALVLREGKWIQDSFAYGFLWVFLLEAIASVYFLFSHDHGSALGAAGTITHLSALLLPTLTLETAMLHLYQASEQYRSSQDHTNPRWGVRAEKSELTAEIFHRALQQAYDPLYITDRAGQVAFVNSGFTRVTGFAPGDVIGETPDSWHIAPEKGEYTRVLREVGVRKEPVAVTLYRKRKDGDKFEVSVHVSPILNEVGEVKWFIVREHDLSEAKDRTLLLQQILDNMPLGICLLEVPSTKVLLANQYAETLFHRLGLKQVAEFREVYPFLRLTGGVLYPEEKLPAAVTVRTEEVTTTDDIEVWRHEGKVAEMIWKMHATPLFDAHGKLRHVLLSFDDVTREKQLAHKMTDSVSVAAHQLRTPLTGMKWALDEYRKSNKSLTSDKDQAALFDTLYEATVRMFNVIQGLLDAAKIEQGKVEQKPEPVKLDEFIGKIFSEFSHLTSGKKLQVKQSVLHTIPETSYDLILVRQVVQNLLDNAVKYTPDGGEIDSILSCEKNRVHWTLHDTGIGITKEDLDHLFEKFHRGDNAQQLDAYGMGLGLYTVKSIMDLLGGEMRCESEVEHGTTFHVYFPVKK